MPLLRMTIKIFLATLPFLVAGDIVVIPNSVWDSPPSLSGDACFTFPEPVTGWTLHLVFSDPVDRLECWTARVVNTTHNRTEYVLKNMDWNGYLTAGDHECFSFNAHGNVDANTHITAFIEEIAGGGTSGGTTQLRTADAATTPIEAAAATTTKTTSTTTTVITTLLTTKAPSTSMPVASHSPNQHVASHPSNVKASMCAVCGGSPDNACTGAQETQIDVCHQPAPYCATVINSTGGYIQIWKGCMDEPTCIQKWWISTRTNPKCSKETVTTGKLPPDTSCFYCCHEPDHAMSALHCNDNLYPKVTSDLSFTETITGAAHLQTSPQAITTPIEAATTTSSPSTTRTVLTTLLTTKASSTSVPVMSHPSNQPVTETKCPICSGDSTVGRTCEATQYIDNCSADSYCMTSFSRHSAGYQVTKRCATLDECSDLWLNKTSTIPECTSSALQLGGGSDLLCDYCCRNMGATTFCNAGNSLIPKHLLSVAASTLPTATTSEHVTSPSASAATKVQCSICVADSDAGRTCAETQYYDTCGSTQQYCMTSFFRHSSGYQLNKRCARLQECSDLWLNKTRSNPQCMSSVLRAEAGSDLNCYFCCQNSVAELSCNADETIIPASIASAFLIG